MLPKIILQVTDQNLLHFENWCALPCHRPEQGIWILQPHKVVKTFPD